MIHGLRHTFRRFAASFSFRIFLLVAASFLLLGLVFSYSFIRVQQRALEQDLISEGKSLVTILANISRLALFANDPARLPSETASLLNLPYRLQLTVLDADGRIFYQQGQWAVMSTQATMAASLQRARQLFASGSGPVNFRTNNHFEFWAPIMIGTAPYQSEEYYFEQVAASTPTASEVIGFAVLRLDRAVLHERFQKVMQENLRILALLSPLSLVITFLISRLAAKPLTNLIQRIQEKTGQGENDNNEVATLANTFEDLLASLQQAFDTIHDLKQELEERVRQRTADLRQANQELAERQLHLERANRDLEHALRELKEAQSRLVQSEKMAALGMLVAGIAHEINNNTNFISAAISPTRRTLRQVEEQTLAVLGRTNAPERQEIESRFHEVHELLGHMAEGARRTAKIVADLRDFSRPGTERKQLADIHRHLDTTLTLLQHLFKDRITVVRQYQPGMGLVMVYPDQLCQVFMNLLANAAQAIDGQGTITIATRLEGGLLRVRISDTGCGIEPQNLARIFDPFFTTKPPGQGTGLGLSISYSIIEKHGGEILVESTPGQGSSFEIVIPASEEATTQPTKTKRNKP